MRETRKVSRRQLLGGAARTATLAGGMFLDLSGRAVAAPAGLTTGDPTAPRTAAVRPARQVRDVRPGVAHDAIALTIDDGPHPLWTPQMLDLLHRNGIRATFSLIGAQAHAYPGLVKRILAEGHSVCNHSMTHPQPFSRGAPATIRQQIADAQSAIVDAGGVPPKLFRAPAGDWSVAVLSAVVDLQMAPIGWDIDPRDWSRPGTVLIISRLLTARPGDILLCHDGGGDRAQTLESLRTVLPTLKSRGLEFVTL
ncbi:MAG: polysaccharide deacetylase family protein [Pseudonocardiales bacterium]|nr:polysaccharide deacetylase family protein [Pseudonocardiales bacterium]MBV9730020.1 polysaccharide deacetylase family protein [Pseudonocardiales bacterium]